MNYIGITMGDPAGIGCEVTLKALKDNKISNKCVVYGSEEVLRYYKSLLQIDKKINVIKSLGEFKSNMINLVNVFDLSMDQFNVGKVSKVAGEAAYKYIEAAIDAAKCGDISAVVTGPINKESLNLAGYDYAGHTEIFATLTETKDYAMLLWGENLKVIHVSTHVSLREACNRVKKYRIMKVIELADEALKQTGIQEPSIAVAGLNPHAGESGLFGTEEIEEIFPAIKESRNQGIKVDGPFPPDTIFLSASKGKYDIVVVMYHDQGHIPIKLLSFDTGVNITVGLPIIRTSVDHGTAFDIAGSGKASELSMIEAIAMATKFVS